MPIGALGTAGRQVFRLLRRLRDELGVNTTCGASNVSFGLPNREGINAAFLAMAIASGLTSAITNPLLPEVRKAIMAADVLMGNDPRRAGAGSARTASPRSRGRPGGASTADGPPSPVSSRPAPRTRFGRRLSPASWPGPPIP